MIARWWPWLVTLAVLTPWSIVAVLIVALWRRTQARRKAEAILARRYSEVA